MFIGTTTKRDYGPMGVKVRDVNSKRMLVKFKNRAYSATLIAYYNLSCEDIAKAMDVVAILDRETNHPDDLPF